MQQADNPETVPQSKKRSVASSLVSRVGSWWLGLFLIAAILLAYRPAWTGKPIWDDDAHLTKPELQSLTGLVRIWIEPGTTPQYYPLVHSVFWVEHKLWGDTTLGYHLVNILLHVTAAILLLKILRTLGIPAAELAAAIFALHPIQVESVAWISELKNTLSAVFYFSSALAYLQFDRTRNRRMYAVALILFAGGLMSKTVVATLPAALLVIFWWERGRLSWNPDVWPLVPFFAAGLIAGLFTAWMEVHLVQARGSEFDFSLLERILIAGRVSWFYLGKLFWPADLIFSYPPWNINQVVAWQYLFPAAMVLLAGALWGLRRRWRGPLAAFLFYIGTLFPALGFFNVYPFRYSFVADHFQYLACIGPIVLTSVGIDALFRSYGRGKRLWEKVFCAALVAVLTGLTWQQSKMYSDPETLWRTTITRNPDSYLACCNLGSILLDTGRVNAAIEMYRRALAIRPRDALAENNLGIALLHSGKVDEAILRFNRTLQIDPGYFAAYNNLSDAFLQKGEVEAAIAAYEKALAIQPNDATIQNNLGYVCLQAGRVDEAILHDRKALRIQPNNPDFHYNLANALAQRGQVYEAKEQFQATLKIRPDSLAALNNLAWLLATCPDANIRNGAQAVGLAEQANRLSEGANPAILDTLAAAYAEDGRYPEAVTAARQALQLARAQNQTSMADAIQLQIELYQAGSPYREINQTNNMSQPERP